MSQLVAFFCVLIAVSGEEDGETTSSTLGCARAVDSDGYSVAGVLNPVRSCGLAVLAGDGHLPVCFHLMSDAMRYDYMVSRIRLAYTKAACLAGMMRSTQSGLTSAIQNGANPPTWCSCSIHPSTTPRQQLLARCQHDQVVAEKQHNGPEQRIGPPARCLKHVERCHGCCCCIPHILSCLLCKFNRCADACLLLVRVVGDEQRFDDRWPTEEPGLWSTLWSTVCCAGRVLSSTSLAPTHPPPIANAAHVPQGCRIELSLPARLLRWAPAAAAP